jgi:tartrate-resistant acid phosphatase type 5
VIFSCLLFLLTAAEPPFRTYVGDLDSQSVTLAWGRASGTTTNTIGRGAQGSGPLEVKIDGRSIASTKAWEKIEGLQPDTVYPYAIIQNGQTRSQGVVRTWPAKTSELTFFVIGDFGEGSKRQYEIARRMEEERSRLEKSGIAVRFVLSVGDNIYGKLSASGGKDRDWEKKYFLPYAETLAAIPFKAVLGNHDGNESENAADLPVCLDNFFMPGRWYRFSYGSFAEFFALDSTRNLDDEHKQPPFLPGGEQSKWLEESASQPALPWRMAVMHHPMFTAGPLHKPALSDTRHWFDTFRRSNFRIVFSGHEHNLQFSEQNDATARIQFVLSGAGGELRTGDISKNMTKEHIRAWANVNHFLVVRIQDRVATIQPVGAKPFPLRDAAGAPVQEPISVVLHED